MTAVPVMATKLTISCVFFAPPVCVVCVVCVLCVLCVLCVCACACFRLLLDTCQISVGSGCRMRGATKVMFAHDDGVMLLLHLARFGCVCGERLRLTGFACSCLPVCLTHRHTHIHTYRHTHTQTHMNVHQFLLRHQSGLIWVITQQQVRTVTLFVAVHQRLLKRGERAKLGQVQHTRVISRCGEWIKQRFELWAKRCDWPCWWHEGERQSTN